MAILCQGDELFSISCRRYGRFERFQVILRLPAGLRLTKGPQCLGQGPSEFGVVLGVFSVVQWPIALVRRSLLSCNI